MKVPLKFIEHLSIHGIRHIFIGYRSKFTRFFWSFALLASFIGLCVNNYLLFMKLNYTPDINVRIGHKFSNNVPFPAITICNPLFARDQLVKYFNITKILRRKFDNNEVNLNLTVTEQNYLGSNVHACEPDVLSNLKFNLLNRTEFNIVKLLRESSLVPFEAIINCGFNGWATDCSSVVNRVLTDRGFCYSINMQGFNTIFNEKVISEDFHSYKRINIAKSIDSRNKLYKQNLDDNSDVLEWSLERGYDKDHDSDAVPIKAERGKVFGCNPYLKESDATNICIRAGNTYSYFFHLPNEILMPSHQEHVVEFKKKKDILLTAKSYKADEGMRKFSPKSRGCYFEGEKQLKYFKTYTKALCEYECMTNYTLKTCGCVKFSMPRSADIPVCDVEASSCYFLAMLKWPDQRESKDRFEATCGCLKPCNNIKYEVKFEKTSSSENVMVIYDVFNFSRGDAISRLIFTFDDFEIIEYEEYASYKLHNFVADIGGLLGFFLGCSILSIIEVIYFVIETALTRLSALFNRRSKIKSKRIFINSKNMKSQNAKLVKAVEKISNDPYIDPIRIYEPSKFHNRKFLH